ncbi:NAD-dependent dehydratase [candidate division MSBL1 archaeon SCGC-AAA259E19]|uniref:GDP-L-fucose synthase n=1 Tax=candidate division MSBL1 archaeon SCGC-AAA259E19 TaxID=1698264 RepID=A0A133UMM2_9EURY|nr:NAD-dependent dehydratase [candidate division MSBL1 archaeon SCGC-AAA259E19]
MELKDKTICVTGGSGFLGSFVVEELEDRGYQDIFVPRSKDYDLRKTEAVGRMYEDSDADIVIHLAASVGGIAANRKYPGDFFYDNAKMGIELIEHGRQNDVDKLVTIGTICAYPKHTPVPFEEKNLWDGYPEETNAPYGLAKKMLLVQTQAYHDQYGFNGIYLLPVNLYGPRDDFNPETSHVIPAIIRKCVEAREREKDEIVAWGTGEPTREFLYVEDAARGIVDAMEKYEKPEPVNLGSGMEISIRDLVYKIKDLVGFDGEVKWDTSKPGGQPRRKLDVSKAKEEFGWEAKTDFEEGLKETIEWYTENKDSLV